MRERILILTHGGWGNALLKGVEMILGKVDFVDEIPLYPQDTQKEFESKVEGYILKWQKKIPDGLHITIITDMFGGTTTNTSVYVARRYEDLVSVITGLNAPVLLEACSQITFNSGLDMQRLLQESRFSIFDVMEKIYAKGVMKDGKNCSV